MRYFTIDSDPRFLYRPFFDDFGPPSIAHLVDFSRLVTELMIANPTTLCHFYTSPAITPTTNSVLYIAFFRMLTLNTSPDDTYRPFRPIEGTLKPFRDASTLPSVFDLRIIDCLRGIHRAISFGWLQMDTFDSEGWRSMEAIEHGDMNWIIPGKILALASPYSTNTLPGGLAVCSPADLIAPFHELGITHVIRLNKQFYDAGEFRQAGFEFTELYFVDGSCPPDSILAGFLEIAESDAIIAIHCKAGLGRTGTLIASHMIKNCEFTAREAIGWIRLCRPGSVIGPQQLYLVNYEEQVRVERNPVIEPEVEVREIPVPVRLRKIYFSPMKGFPMEEENEEGNKQLTARRSVRISKPFASRKNERFGSIQSMAVHPQPRKINQKAVLKAGC